jgi:hypothetical protein
MSRDIIREPKPSDGLLQQKMLSIGSPTDWDSGSPVVSLKLDFLTRKKNNKSWLIFKYTINPINQLVEGLSLAVIKNCCIIVELANDKHWRWSNVYQGITTKCDHADLYFDLQYSEDGNNWSNWVNGISGNYRFVKIKAKQKQDIPENTSELHGFSFNIELLIPEDAGDREYWLPITLDPDIINPKDPAVALVDGEGRRAAQDLPGDTSQYLRAE